MKNFKLEIDEYNMTFIEALIVSTFTGKSFTCKSWTEEETQKAR